MLHAHEIEDIPRHLHWVEVEYWMMLEDQNSSFFPEDVGRSDLAEVDVVPGACFLASWRCWSLGPC